MDGSLYVSHLQEGVPNPPPSRMLKITGGAVEEFLFEAGTNGLALGSDGAIVGARHADGTVSRLDLADPDYQAAAPRPQARTRVYRIAPSGEVTVVDEERTQPNGVTLSADERTLYVATPQEVLRYAVAPDGSVGAPSSFAGIGSDGMAMDCAGNLYLTSGRDIVVVSPRGETIGRIANAVPDGASTTNVAFGGADRKRLFITARGERAGLWYADLQVPGMPY
jgi:gluconolactonase